jgi:hypothetical protein
MGAKVKFALRSRWLASSPDFGMSLFMSLEFINPQLASPVDHPPPHAGWIHEVKHD